MAQASQEWFHTNVFSGRVISSTIWTVLISSIWLLLVSFLSYFLQSPLHPISALSSTTQLLVSPSSLFYVLVFTSSLVWGSVKHSQGYSVTPSVFHSWSKLILSAIQPTTATSLAQFILQSTVMAWCFVKLVWPQYSSLFSSCHEDESSWCVSHDQLFLLGCGAVDGIYLGVRYHFYSGSCVSSPVIYKDTTSQIKQQMKPLLLSSAKEALHVLKYYYVIYFMSTLAISSSLPLAPISSFFSLSLFVAALSLTTLVIIVNTTRLKVFSIFLTAPLPSQPLEQLISSLSPSSPLLNLLSLQAMARLTATSSSARCTIFSLSQPGGHPHSWKAVSQACLETVDSITSSINNLSSPKPPPPSTSTPKPQVQQIASPNMRRLAPITGAKLEDVSVAPTASPATQMVSNITSMLDSVKKQPGLALLFKVQPDAGLRAIFCQSQAAIWSVDVLSHLVANSITEDRFGVVQKELPTILTSLLTLDQKLFGPRKTGGMVDEDIKLKHEAMVRACVRCKKRFFKDEGCNKMQCECGQSMCYLCRKPVENDYTHFYAQGASPVKGKCPLWSDNINLHKAEVMKAAEEAKKAVDGKKLKYDPTKNMEKPPEGFDPKALHNNFGGNGEYMEGHDDDSDDESDDGSFIDDEDDVEYWDYRRGRRHMFEDEVEEDDFDDEDEEGGGYRPLDWM